MFREINLRMLWGLGATGSHGMTIIVYGLKILNKMPTLTMRLSSRKNWYAIGTGAWDYEALLEVCLNSETNSFQSLKPERVSSEVKQSLLRSTWILIGGAEWIHPMSFEEVYHSRKNRIYQIFVIGNWQDRNKEKNLSIRTRVRSRLWRVKDL